MSEYSPRVPDTEGLHSEFNRLSLGNQLHLQQCGNCGRFHHPPRYRCPFCSSDAVSWTPSSGRGELHSWTMTHAAFDRGWATMVPYATGVVELEEGVRLVGSLDGIDQRALAIGLRLEASLQQMGETFVFISFRLPGE